MSRQSVLQFTDYRTFLRTYAEDRKLESSHFSYGVWAKQMKLAGTASLTMVIKGQRKPGPKMVSAFCRYFKFNEKESHYFEDLVRLDKAGGDARLKIMLMKALKARSKSFGAIVLDDKTFDAISSWCFYLIRQATRLSEFESDVTWIQRKCTFSISQQRIKAAVKILLELNLLRVDANGRLRTTSGNLNTQNDIASEAVRRYHEDVIALGRDSVRRFSVEERELQSMSFAMNSRRIAEAKEAIRVFVSEFTDEFSSDQEANLDSVFQLNLQLFPVLKNARGGSL